MAARAVVETERTQNDAASSADDSCSSQLLHTALDLKGRHVVDATDVPERRERTAVECATWPVPSVLAGTDWLRVLLMKNRGFYQW